MSNRTLKWLAWGIALLSLLSSATTEILAYLNPSRNFEPRLGTLGIVLPLSIVGASIVSRLPRHLIGWLFCLIGLWALQAFAGTCSAYLLARDPHSSAGDWLAWLSAWVTAPGVGLSVLALFLFPTGQLLSPRWKTAVWSETVGIALISAGIAFFPGRAPFFPSRVTFDNPIGLSGQEGVLTLIIFFGSIFFWASAFAALISLVLRMRRAGSKERQQIKWVAYGSAVSILLYFLSGIIPQPGRDVLAAVAAPLTPLAAGIAILRYQLYDIDLIIRRTLIYSVLTAILGFLYLSSVIVLQQMFRLITGAGGDLAIIVSTLAIAGLFNPLRRRVQDGIDRRFYRQKYDAIRVLEQFGVAVRDQVDLNKLNDELLTVVERTMEPASIGLWLKSAGRK